MLFAKLSEHESMLIALSGGTDSAYLAWAAHRVLGKRALSVTALSPSYSTYDREQLEKFLEATAIRHEFVETHEMEKEAYRANNADRCYFCKDELFAAMDQIAAERNFAATAYGVNADDTFDFRPGHRAAKEHRVLTPLLDAKLHKAEIRYLSERAGLPSWDRPASACLASRLPYGTEVTPERLSLVERGEAALRGLGFLPIPGAAARQVGQDRASAGRTAKGAIGRNGGRHGQCAEGGRIHVCGIGFGGLPAGLVERELREIRGNIARTKCVFCNRRAWKDRHLQRLWSQAEPPH